MARPGRPERNKEARSFLQLRRFRHLINADKVFSTHRLSKDEVAAAIPDLLLTGSDAEILAAEDAATKSRLDLDRARGRCRIG